MISKEEIIKLIKQRVQEENLKNKKFIIAANWKMQKNNAEVSEFLTTLIRDIPITHDKVIIFPPCPYLYLLRDKLKSTIIKYGVQNLCWEDYGAFSGEVSPKMALDFGCQYAIIGHSERRNIFNETDDVISKKVEACIKNNISPILCIGESNEERNSNKYKQKLKNQLLRGFDKVKAENIKDVIVAYEPIWAIGTGQNATPEQVEETHQHIRNVLTEMYKEPAAESIPILYGGSVKISNVKEISSISNVSGFLIGGASLQAKEFIKIISLLS